MLTAGLEIHFLPEEKTGRLDRSLLQPDFELRSA